MSVKTTSVSLVTPDGPPPVQAAGLALAILQRAKVAAWEELEGRLPNGVTVSDEQLELLNSQSHLLRLLRVRVTTDAWTGGTVTVAVCPRCSRWLLLSGGGAPSSCTLTRGCGGAPVKASAARLSKDG